MNYRHAARNWFHVAGRATLYGTISVVVGSATRNRRIGQWAMRQWCEGCCNGLRIRRRLIDGDLLASSPQCVFVSNHLSQLDILVLGSYLRHDYRWLAKASLFKIPFMGWHLTLSGHVPVYRGEGREKNNLLAARIHRVVEQGASLLFFPEGTRSEDGKLQNFKIGAFAAAIREQLPVVPLVVRGTHELFVRGSVDLQVDAKRECSVTVLPPIEPPQGDDDRRRAENLRDLVHEAINRELCGGAAI